VLRSKETTIHRFRGTYTFDGLATVLGHVYGSSSSSSKKLVIEYDDDESDRVRIASEIEWVECVRLSSGITGPLKLYVRRGKGEEAKKKPESPTKAKDDSDSDHDHDAPIVPKLALPKADEEKAAETSVPELPPLNASSTAAPKAPAHDYQCESQQDKLVLELVSTLFKCDAAHELMSPLPGVDFGSVVRRVVDPLRQEVHIDIDRQVLRHRAVVTANAMIDASENTAAQAVLEAANALFADDFIIEYNLACVAALLGNTEAAVIHLEHAVAHGYNKVNHLEQDADLASIMGDARVVALVRKMKGEPEPTVPEPVVAAQPASAVQDPNVRSVLSIFPDLSEADIKALLAEHKNNVHAVVNFLLNA
jgi:hypothetical protein